MVIEAREAGIMRRPSGAPPHGKEEARQQRKNVPGLPQQVSVAWLLPELGALSNSLEQSTLRSLESRPGISAENIVVDFPPDGANGAHRCNGCFDFRVSGHELLRRRGVREAPAVMGLGLPRAAM
jgi:hypothetical protein